MKQIFFMGALCAGCATIIVGSSVAVSDLLQGYPVLGGQAIRYAFGAGALALVVRMRGIAWPRVTWRDVVQLVLLALTGMIGFNLCLLGALRYSDPAAVGAIVGGVPILLAVVGPLLQRRLPQVLIIIGAVIVTMGVGITQGSGSTSGIGLLLSVGALLGEASFTLLAISIVSKLGPIILSLYVCITASLILAVLSILVDGSHAFPLPTLPQLLALSYMAIIVTALAFLCWYAGLTRLGSERAGLFSGIIPISSLFCGALLGANALTPLRMLGSALVASGVIIGSLSQNRQKSM